MEELKFNKQTMYFRFQHIEAFLIRLLPFMSFFSVCKWDSRKKHKIAICQFGLCRGRQRKKTSKYGIIGSLSLYGSVSCKDRLRNKSHSQTSKH